MLFYIGGNVSRYIINRHIKTCKMSVIVAYFYYDINDTLPNSESMQLICIIFIILYHCYHGSHSNIGEKKHLAIEHINMLACSALVYWCNILCCSYTLSLCSRADRSIFCKDVTIRWCALKAVGKRSCMCSQKPILRCTKM